MDNNPHLDLLIILVGSLGGVAFCCTVLAIVDYLFGIKI